MLYGITYCVMVLRGFVSYYYLEIIVTDT